MYLDIVAIQFYMTYVMNLYCILQAIKKRSIATYLEIIHINSIFLLSFPYLFLLPFLLSLIIFYCLFYSLFLSFSHTQYRYNF